MEKNTKIALYKILFKDGTVFNGGHDVFNTKWLEIPNKKIKKLFYRLPGGDYLCLGGYDKYFHRIEATVDLNGKEKGKTKLQSVYIYGRKKDKVVVYQIGLIKDVNLGLIYKKIIDINDKEIKNLNPNNWKQGGTK